MGVASDQEAREVERMAALFPEIKAQIEELQGKMKNYCKAHALQKPESPLNQKMPSMPSANSGHSHNKRETARIWKFAAAAGFLLFIGSTVYFSNQQQKANTLMANLSQQVDDVEEKYQAVSGANQLLNARFALLQDIQTKHIHLFGSRVAPDARVVVYWNPIKKDACVNLVNLPTAPEHHQFQIWAVIGGNHVNMGLLNPLSQETMYPIPYMEKCTGFAITLEKEGGSDYPDTAKLFVRGEI